MDANLDPGDNASAEIMDSNSSYRLPVPGGRSFELMVDRNSQDEITQAIVQQYYGYPPGFSLLAELVKPGGRALDLGAHIGTFTLYAAAQHYQVLAVEASPQNLALLQASLQRNADMTVQLHHAAVSDQAGSLDFISAGPYGLVANPAVVGPAVSVRALTVDGLLAEVGWERVDFIKLDIEGSEVKAVLGMQNLLSRTDGPAILYESNAHTLHMFGETPISLKSALAEFGYHSYLVAPPWLRPVEATDFQPAPNVDYLAVKQPLSRLKEWQVGAPLSRIECMAILADCASRSNPVERTCVARALASADPKLLAEPRVQEILRTLQHDPEEQVRSATTWWNSAAASVPAASTPSWRRWWTSVRSMFNRSRPQG